MKRYFILLAATCSILFAKAQDYTFSRKTISEHIYTDDSYADYNINITNQTSQKLSLSWHLVENSYPASWDYSLCDFGTCFVSIPQANKMDSIPIGGTGFLKINLSPAGIAGTGEVKLAISKSSDPSNTDTLTFRITASGSTGINDPGLAGGIYTYPNPVQKTLHVANAATFSNAHYTISDYTGRTILSGELQPEIDTEKLAPGMYILGISDDRNRVQQKPFIRYE